RPMSRADEAAILKFANGLAPHDLLFLRRDIRNAKVVSAWMDQIESGEIETVLAMSGDDIVGCAALITDPLSWSPHVGEVRVLVAPGARQAGLGRQLIRDVFRIAIERGLTKLIAHMTVDQQGAIAIFEELGFRGEALLKDHVTDGEGETHDIAILSCDPASAARVLMAYGRGEGG
ncbi:MAG: GNAT family N-acetyltransferase, partial [Henriciella sp.]